MSAADERLAVSFDVSAVPAHPVGAGRYTTELRTALAGRDDVTLTLWCRRSDADRWLSGAGRVVARVPDRRPLRLSWEQLRLGRCVDSLDADVHHGPHYTMPAWMATPAVVTVHDLTFLDHPEWHERAKVPVFRRAIRVAARRAAAVVCVSRRVADAFEERCRPVGRVFVVPHGVDHTRFVPTEPSAGADAAVLRRLGVRPPFALFLGTIEPRKSIPALVAAFDRVAGGHPELRLVLAGRPGWGSEPVDRSVARSPRAERIVRTGYVPDAAVPALLREASVVVYPALEEGFGLPALEALACGAPLVTTAGTAMADLAGDAAWQVPPGSIEELAAAMASALDGGPETDARRAAGLALSAAHTWAASAEGHVEAYRWAAAHPLRLRGRRSRRPHSSPAGPAPAGPDGDRSL